VGNYQTQIVSKGIERLAKPSGCTLALEASHAWLPLRPCTVWPLTWPGAVCGHAKRRPSLQGAKHVLALKQEQVQTFTAKVGELCSAAGWAAAGAPRGPTWQGHGQCFGCASCCVPEAITDTTRRAVSSPRSG